MYNFDFDGAIITTNSIFIPMLFQDANEALAINNPTAKFFIGVGEDSTKLRIVSEGRIIHNMDCPWEYGKLMWEAMEEWMNSTKYFQGWREVCLPSWSLSALVKMILCVKEGRKIERLEKILKDVIATGVSPKSFKRDQGSKLFESMDASALLIETNI